MDIRSLLDRQGRLQAERPFLTWAPFAGPARRWCFAEFVHAVRRFAAGLHRRGVAPGDRILIHLENCPEGLIAWLGSAYAGVVPVTTNARSTATDLAYFAAHSRAVGAVTQPRFAAMVRAAAPSLGWIVQTDHDAGEPAATARPADERFEDLAADPSILPPRAPDPWAPFGIQYTSGTTARPKAVLWTHGNALWGARSSAWHEGLRAGDVQLVHLPLFHTNAQVYSVLAALWAGASIVLMPRFSASRFWPISVEHGATFTSLVPFCVRSLLDQPVPEDHAYRLWANAVCAPLSDARFGIRTMGWWGMTETIAHGIVGTHDGEDTPMSMGRPAPGYAVYILDQHGAPVRAGETGDLFVGGVPGVSLFLGYADDPAATARAFRPDGLFITGDRVRVDEDGSLFFADRSKDMLKVGGENVAASEIESVIARVAGVAEVAVVAMPHAMLDEAPAAFVLPAADIPDDLPARIEMACAAHLASFKRPHLVRIVDALPRATLGKIEKAQLRETLLADMEAKS